MIDSVEYFFYSVFRRIAQLLSYRGAERVGSVLGGAVFSLTPIRKEVTMSNLRHAFPQKTDGELRNIARGAFCNYGITFLEALWSGNKSSEQVLSNIRVENPEVMESALAKKKGVLFLSGHYGGWEFLIAAVSVPFRVHVATIVQRQRNKKIDAALDAMRCRFGNSSIPMGVSSRRVLTELAANNVVALLGDQSGPKEAAFVNFFGRPAATHRGVAAFSMKTGAPIVMGFLVRQPDGSYVFTLEEVDKTGLSTSDDESINELTRRHVTVLEKWIRMHPDHWLWMHKRWKHTGYAESQHLIEEKA